MAVACYRAWNTIRNIGDTLTPALIHKLLGIQARFSSADQPHVIGPGSTFFLANEQSYMWGTGIISWQSYIPDIDSSRILAIRGQKTADLLAERELKIRDIPFGDPGIFAAELIEDFGPVDIKYKAALIPHHESLQHPLFRSAADSAEICVVDILQDNLSPIIQIAQSDVVISQSLHGLIFAASLGKPYIWISRQDDPVWTFKFEDWFSTSENAMNYPASMEESLEDLIDMCEMRPSKIVKRDLLEAFPTQVIERNSSVMMDYKECRSATPVTIYIDGWKDRFPISLNCPSLDFITSLGISLAASLTELFKGWAEPVYAIAILNGVGVCPTPNQKKHILKSMDQMHRVSHAYVVSNSDYIGTDRGIDIGFGVRQISDTSHIGGTIVARPDYRDLDGFHVLFVID